MRRLLARGEWRRWLIGKLWDYTISRSGGTCTVALCGELDMSVRDDVAEVLLNELNQPGSIAVRADLSQVTFLDSSGIAALVKVRHDAEAHGLSFTIVGPRGAVRRTLEITGVLSVLGA
jgi:anti-sigma B factor antagonist